MKITAQSLEKSNSQSIKFPHLTKLQFTGNSTPKQLSRCFLNRLNTSTSKKTIARFDDQIKDLKIIYQPKQGVINICSMKLVQNADYNSNKDAIENKRISLKKYAQHKPILLKTLRPIIMKQFTKQQNIYQGFLKLFLGGFGLVSNIETSKKETAIKILIDKGNNSLLVKHILNSHGYGSTYSIYDVNQQYNLIWNQFRNKQYVSSTNLRSSKESIMTINRELLKSIQKNEKLMKLLFIKTDFKENKQNLGELIKKINSNNKYQLQPKNLKFTNHLPQNTCITNKKNLFKNLKLYYQNLSLNPFQTIPLTFHIRDLQDPQFIHFISYSQNIASKKSLWIIKPGENTNRGNGITIQKGVQAVKTYLQQLNSKHTHIIQLYIRPYLYQERKFDIRWYLLVIMVNKKIKAYWYEEGYIRTSAQKFSIRKTDKLIHLTNDAIQKNGQNYGKYESGNKLSCSQLHKYMKTNSSVSFFQEIVPKMKNMCQDILFSTKQILGGSRNQEGFQIYGLDFVIDNETKPWLIQVNTNPCLQLSCSILSRIIPQMLENSFRLCLDPFSKNNGAEDLMTTNKFELIFEN